MSVKDHLRQPAGLVTAGLFGVAGGVLAAIRATEPWIGLPIGAAIFAVVLGAYAVTAMATVRAPVEPEHAPPITTEPVPVPPPRAEKPVGLLFVHGFLSSPEAWSPFVRLIEADPDLAALDPLPFRYDSPVARIRPDRATPDFDTVARRLGTYLEVERRYRALAIVTHSQGGLIVQRYLAKALDAGWGGRLTRIRLIVMFACPNSGSEFFLSLRRMWPPHPQEEQLRPLNTAITETHRKVINNIINARMVSDHECPIRFRVYAGESDRVVTPASAHSVFPDENIGVVAGDHFSLIRPDSPSHESYLTLKKDLLDMLDELDLSPGNP